MKRLLALLAMVPLLAFGAANDIQISQINAAGTAAVTHAFAPSSGTQFTTLAGWRTAQGIGLGDSPQFTGLTTTTATIGGISHVANAITSANSLTSGALSNLILGTGTFGTFMTAASATGIPSFSTQITVGAGTTIKGVTTVFSGDSLTAPNGDGGIGAANMWPLLWSGLFDPLEQTTKQNSAVSGQTAATILSNYSTQIGAYVPSTGQTGLLSLWAGTNDIGGGASAATIYSTLQSIWSNWKTVSNQKVLAWTIAPRSDYTVGNGKETVRLALNSSIKGNTALYDYIYDVASVLTDSTNLNNFNADGIHNTASANQGLAWGIYNIVNGTPFPRYDFLTGIDTSTTGSVTNQDSIFSALGKLQATKLANTGGTMSGTLAMSGATAITFNGSANLQSVGTNEVGNSQSSGNVGLRATTSDATGLSFVNLINSGSGGQSYSIGVGGHTTGTTALRDVLYVVNNLNSGLLFTLSQTGILAANAITNFAGTDLVIGPSSFNSGNSLTFTSATGAASFASSITVATTSRLNGNVGIGGASNSAVGLFVQSSLNGSSNDGFNVSPTFGSSASGSSAAGRFKASTTAAAYTAGSVYGVTIDSPTKGAGSTITTLYGLNIADQTAGSTNYAIKTGLGLVSFADTTEATNGGVGSLTTAGGIYAAKRIISGTDVVAVGNLATDTVGKTLLVKSGTNALSGTVTLTAGAGTISSTAIDANTVIVITLKTVGGTILGQPYVDTITAGTGCTLAGGGASNTSTYNWVGLKVN